MAGKGVGVSVGAAVSVGTTTTMVGVGSAGIADQADAAQIQIDSKIRMAPPSM